MRCDEFSVRASFVGQNRNRTKVITEKVSKGNRITELKSIWQEERVPVAEAITE